MKQTIWKKDKFIIRLAQLEDIETYYHQNYCPLDKEVARLTGSKENFTKDEVVSYMMNAIESDDCYFFFIIAPHNRIIGESVINEIDWNLRSAHFRIDIYESTQRGQGLGTWVTEVTRDFAFEELKLHRLELEVYSFNPRAQKVYLKAGFKQEGILKDAIKDGHQYADNILMAMLEEDWHNIKNRD